MNKPASKEPSMDEILSSIRQIIADDDAAVAPRQPPIPPATPAARPVASVSPLPVTPPRPVPPVEEPLALKPEQVLRTPPAREPVVDLDLPDLDADGADEDIAATAAPELVDPEDVAFEVDEPEPAPEPEPIRSISRPVVAPPPARPPEPPPVPPRAPAFAHSAPMPDPTLSRDMAEQLLAPAADAAVKSTFAKLNGLSLAGSSATIEDLMRDMLRPMLKEWLDENLPAVVERMVEKEIARVSRGGE